MQWFTVEVAGIAAECNCCMLLSWSTLAAAAFLAPCKMVADQSR